MPICVNLQRFYDALLASIQPRPQVFSLFNLAAAREKTLEKSEKVWLRDMARVKINKMAEKAEVHFKKKRGKTRQVLHVRVLGIRQSDGGLVFAVHGFFFVILKLGVMGLSVLDCGTPGR